MPLTARQRSIHNKNGVRRSSTFKEKRTRKASEGGLVGEVHGVSYPGGALALALLLAARLAAALWAHVADCDETYNYWEPLHYLVYGSGLQTWEYSPAHALRSYAALWPLAAPARLLAPLLPPRAVFYCVRALLAALSACAHLTFYKAVCQEFGVNVGRVWVALAAGAAGAWGAAPALLPSALADAALAAAAAAWWQRRYRTAVFMVALIALAGWPFTALLGAPIAIDLVFVKRCHWDFLRWSAAAAAAVLAPLVALDSWHYGRLVVAPWNIVKYNVFSEHGPHLYGVEPWTYYFVNGFLNFNIVWVLALSCPLLLLAVRAVGAAGGAGGAGGGAGGGAARAPFCQPYALALLGPALWLLVFQLQPHKEERFLQPIYSMIVLCGAIGLDCVQRLAFAASLALAGGRRRAARHYLAHSAPLLWAAVLLATALSCARVAALWRHYSAPAAVLRHLPPAPEGLPQPLYVCFGKEWHRFPSSFHLPPQYRARFVASDFDGQLPAPYADTHNATRLVHPYFNDANRGDGRTLLAAARCHYLVDSDVGEPTPRQPRYAALPAWRAVAAAPLLDAARSPPLYRAFHLPYLSHKYNVYGTLYLLRNQELLAQ